MGATTQSKAPFQFNGAELVFYLTKNNVKVYVQQSETDYKISLTIPVTMEKFLLHFNKKDYILFRALITRHSTLRYHLKRTGHRYCQLEQAHLKPADVRLQENPKLLQKLRDQYSVPVVCNGGWLLIFQGTIMLLQLYTYEEGNNCETTLSIQMLNLNI